MWNILKYPWLRAWQLSNFLVFWSFMPPLGWVGFLPPCCHVLFCGYMVMVLSHVAWCVVEWLDCRFQFWWLVVYVASFLAFLSLFTSKFQVADLCWVCIVSSWFWCPVRFHFFHLFLVGFRLQYTCSVV